MNFRFPRRALLAFITAIALPIALPAIASAAPTSFSLSALTLGAGTDPNLASTTTFNAGAGTPQSITLALAPGLLASAAANPSCLATAQTSSTTPGTGCNVGNGTFLTPAPVTYNAYVIPAPTPADVAGVEVITSGANTATGAIDLRTSPTVGLNVSLTLSGLPFASTMTGMTLNVNGTLNGNQFTRLPTSCVADTSSVVVAYSGTPSSETATNTTAAAATPTGCSSLPFTPTLLASATKDTGDGNVAITTDVTQPASPIQAPDKTLILTVPPAFLFPNVVSVTNVFGKPISVGTAVATSPLIPTALTGNVTLTGTSELAPNLTITFASPFPLVLTGAVNAVSGSVTFSSIPDVPLTGLEVTLNGGANGLYQTTCSPSSGTLMGAFTGQNGVAFTSNAAVSIAGCASTTPPPTIGKPTVAGSIAGLAKGKGKLSFTVKQGTNAKPIKTIAVSLPSGLKFSSNAKNLKKGIKVSGGTFKVSKGVLTITLKSAAAKATVTLQSPAFSVSSSLAKSVKKHKAKTLSVKIKVTDSGKTTTTLTLKVKPKS